MKGRRFGWACERNFLCCSFQHSQYICTILSVYLHHINSVHSPYVIYVYIVCTYSVVYHYSEECICLNGRHNDSVCCFEEINSR